MGTSNLFCVLCQTTPTNKNVYLSLSTHDSVSTCSPTSWGCSELRSIQPLRPARYTAPKATLAARMRIKHAPVGRPECTASGSPASDSHYVAFICATHPQQHLLIHPANTRSATRAWPPRQGHMVWITSPSKVYPIAGYDVCQSCRLPLGCAHLCVWEHIRELRTM